MLSLDTSVADIPRYGRLFAKRLAKLKITTVRDLLLYFPFRYEDLSRVAPIAQIKGGETVTIRGTVIAIQNRRSFRRRLFLTEALVRDKSATIRVIWFNQAFLTRVLPLHCEVWLSGKVVHDSYGLHLASPVYEKVEKESLHTGRIVPIYSLTPPLTQKQLRVLIRLALPAATLLRDALPPSVERQHKLLPFPETVTTLHFPKTMQEVARARHRMAFAELFALHCRILAARKQRSEETATPVPFFEDETKAFVQSLPFTLTDDQRKAAWEILRDMQKHTPMHRLLNGDVGSGKTVVTAIAAMNVTRAGFRTLYMAPTEILAEQHYRTFSTFFHGSPVTVGLLTASHKLTKQERTNAKLIIGTHALLRGKDPFRGVALVIIDEQHRFGVQQRAALVARRQTQTPSQTDADTEEGFLYGDLTYKIRGIIFDVRKKVGDGHKESVYQNALEIALRQHGIFFEKEKALDIVYEGRRIGVYRPDFVIDRRILLEIKALPFIGNKEEKQVWHYLCGSEYRLALLVNFSSNGADIRRIVYDKAREKSLQSSASSLRKSAFTPHLLLMSATPIPRTLAQTIFGDIDISLLRTLPKGRKTILTRVVTNDLRVRAYDFIKKEIRSGRQAFVICPLIDPSDALGVRAATDVYEHLRKEIFQDDAVGLLHGRVKQKEREQTMRAFVENKINVLVATSIVEVGIDIPNATVMMIEGADRFGLAQLHQLRGRVGRGNEQSYCFLFTDVAADDAGFRRLDAMVKSQDGFALAEADLRHRGPGEMFGAQQSGYVELRFARWNDVALIRETKETAVRLNAGAAANQTSSFSGV